MILWNILIAIFWAAVVGRMNLLNLAVGFLVGFVLLAWLRAAVDHRRYHTRLIRIVKLVALLLWELVASTLRVAHEIVTPGPRSRPGIVGYRLEARTDAEITAFSAVLSFIPGTLSLDLSHDRRLLYIHFMFLGDEWEQIERVRERVERPLLEVVRG